MKLVGTSDPPFTGVGLSGASSSQGQPPTRHAQGMTRGPRERKLPPLGCRPPCDAALPVTRGFYIFLEIYSCVSFLWPRRPIFKSRTIQRKGPPLPRQTRRARPRRPLLRAPQALPGARTHRRGRALSQSFFFYFSLNRIYFRFF